jgi:hypothetical protein
VLHIHTSHNHVISRRRSLVNNENGAVGRPLSSESVPEEDVVNGLDALHEGMVLVRHLVLPRAETTTRVDLRKKAPRHGPTTSLASMPVQETKKW